jgi:hypothetical protein
MAEGKMAEGILANRGKWRGENDEGKMARGNWQRGNCRTLVQSRVGELLNIEKRKSIHVIGYLKRT